MITSGNLLYEPIAASCLTEYSNIIKAQEYEIVIISELLEIPKSLLNIAYPLLVVEAIANITPSVVRKPHLTEFLP